MATWKQLKRGQVVTYALASWTLGSLDETESSKGGREDDVTISRRELSYPELRPSTTWARSPVERIKPSKIRWAGNVVRFKDSRTRVVALHEPADCQKITYVRADQHVDQTAKYGSDSLMETGAGQTQAARQVKHRLINCMACQTTFCKVPSFSSSIDKANHQLHHHCDHYPMNSLANPNYIYFYKHTKLDYGWIRAPTASIWACHTTPRPDIAGARDEANFLQQETSACNL